MMFLRCKELYSILINDEQANNFVVYICWLLRCIEEVIKNVYVLLLYCRYTVHYSQVHYIQYIVCCN
jgi:hypothetical protein